MREILVATGNKGKLCEIRELLHGLPVTITSLADYWDPVPSIPETGTAFSENALQKAVWAFKQKGIWVLADDSGLEVDALGGLPGVRSARFAGEGAGHEANNRKLLELMADVPAGRRTARFTCFAALVTASADYFFTDGSCEGTILSEPKGIRGFGYDPLFVPAGFTKTFAELESADKHEISHRGKALEKMQRHLHELL
jgi:XTP/dITP diphosphohydrolase